MIIHTSTSLQKAHRRQDRQAAAQRQRRERAAAVLAKLKAGAVLCRQHRPSRVIWCLVWKGGSEFLTHELVTDALASASLLVWAALCRSPALPRRHIGTPMTEERGRLFVLKLRPLPGVDAIRALRHVLKRLLRTYGLRCVDLREETDGTSE
jgi:hypothetical protein